MTEAGRLLVQQTNDLATRCQERVEEEKPLCIFVKYFAKILKAKCFTTFYKRFLI